MIITNLLTNLVALLPISGTIPAADAPAYREYALNAILTNAQTAASKWRLDTNPISANRVTRFEALPFPDGSSDISITFDDRFLFRRFRGGGLLFLDTVCGLKWALTATMYKGHSNAVEQVMHGTNQLTLEKAQQIASFAMRSLDVPVDRPGFGRPTRSEQVTWNSGLATYAAPCYMFQWDSGSDGSCIVEVSGISSNIAHFYYDRPCLPLRQPPNFMKLLGLPPDTIFVQSKQLAYQFVAAAVMLAEVNQCAEKLQFPIHLPIRRSDLKFQHVNFSDIGSHTGDGGRLDTARYSFSCGAGWRLQYVVKLTESGGASYVSRSRALARPKSRIGMAEAYCLATNWLKAISVDVQQLELRNPAKIEQQVVYGATGQRKSLSPVFKMIWGRSGDPAVEIFMDGEDRTLLCLRLEDLSFSRRPKRLIDDRERLLRIADEDFLKLSEPQREDMVLRFAATGQSATLGNVPGRLSRQPLSAPAAAAVDAGPSHNNWRFIDQHAICGAADMRVQDR